MGRKRRLISARHKFGNKHSAHPLISQDDVDTEEMGLSEESPAPSRTPVPTPEPAVALPPLVEEKVDVAPVAKEPTPPKKRAPRKRSTASRRTTTRRKTKAKTEASA